MNDIEDINSKIKANSKDIDTDLISDGWHTFGELYNHRSVLFIKLCKLLSKEKQYKVYRSQKHHDGSIMNNYFTLGVELPDKTFIAYHMHKNDWESCDFATTLELSPIKEKYTSKDALNNLEKI